MNPKNALSFSILVVLLLSLNQSIVLSASYINVNVSQAWQMINSDTYLTILDVRTWDEYIGGHIKDATLIPLDEIEGRLGELDRQKPIVVYCKSGGRSATASQILVDNDFIEVYNMLGGIMVWKSGGYPIVQIEVPKDYATIQSAINAAKEGDVISVSSGTYHEQIVVNKTISLIGGDSETTLMDDNGRQTILKIVSRRVNVTRFTIKSGYLGLYLTENADSCIITDCQLINNSVGIFVKSNDNTLAKNVVAGNSESGIEIFADCDCSPLQGNIVTENELLDNSYGIWLVNSEESLVYHNNLVNNGQQVFTLNSSASWDDMYPSGGNYWSNYDGNDTYSGIHQNEAGYDWIGDNPYIIDEDNRDDYPLANLYVAEKQETQVAYRSLLASHNNLQDLYDSLNSTYTTLIHEADNIRIMTYVLVVAAAVFITATAYLAAKIKALRRPASSEERS